MPEYITWYKLVISILLLWSCICDVMLLKKNGMYRLLLYRPNKVIENIFEVHKRK